MRKRTPRLVAAAAVVSVGNGRRLVRRVERRRPEPSRADEHE